MTKKAGSGSLSQLYGSADPDPYQRIHNSGWLTTGKLALLLDFYSRKFMFRLSKTRDNDLCRQQITISLLIPVKLFARRKVKLCLLACAQSPLSGRLPPGQPSGRGGGGEGGVSGGGHGGRRRAQRDKHHAGEDPRLSGVRPTACHGGQFR